MKLRAALFLLITAIVARAEPLRVMGSSTTAQAIMPAARVIFDDTGADLAFETSVGSTNAIYAVANNRIDLAMSTRAIKPEDRSINPKALLFDVEIGIQVIVPIVSKATRDSGVRAVSKTVLIKLYEGDVATWKTVGGPDVKAIFVNPTDGRGIWEPFVTWLYGSLNPVSPGRRWPSAKNNEEARDLVLSTPGALSVVPPKWADGERVVALPIVDENGAVIEPTEANFRSRKWPLTRPILLVAGSKPTGLLRKTLEFMVSPKGQSYVQAAEFLPRPEAADEMAARFR